MGGSEVPSLRVDSVVVMTIGAKRFHSRRHRTESSEVFVPSINK